MHLEDARVRRLHPQGGRCATGPPPGLARLGDLLEDPHQGVLMDIDRLGGQHPQRFRSQVARVFTASREAPAAVGPARVDESDGGRVDAVSSVVRMRSHSVLVEGGDNSEGFAAGSAVRRLEPSPACRTPRTRTHSGLRGRNLRDFQGTGGVVAAGAAVP
jgi:hypothetical protein